MTDDANTAVKVTVTLDIDGDWKSQPLKAVGGIAKGMQALDERLRAAVGVARSTGASWEAIGQALGVSRQSAWERFSTD
jgi:hypothetical protein